MTVAVHADDVALRDLRFDGGDARPIADELRHLGVLVAQVVELQDHRIRLAAVHARRPTQMLGDEAPRCVSPVDARGCDLSQMAFAPLREIRPEASPAVPLAIRAVAVEELERQVEPAATAAADSPGQPDRQRDGA
jgi:hypothetical protein